MHNHHQITESIEAVIQFLTKFQIEVQAGNYTYIRRRNQGKDFLKIFGWTPSSLFEYLSTELEYQDWLSGPEADHNGSPGEIWAFGKVIYSIEFYIKIKDHKGMKCLSFHEARSKCIYPLK